MIRRKQSNIKFFENMLVYEEERYECMELGYIRGRNVIHQAYKDVQALANIILFQHVMVWDYRQKPAKVECCCLCDFLKCYLI